MVTQDVDLVVATESIEPTALFLGEDASRKISKFRRRNCWPEKGWIWHAKVIATNRKIKWAIEVL